MSREENLRMVLRLEYLEAGIVPLATYDDVINLKKALDSLPADEARKMKRKYRKLWRKSGAHLDAKKKDVTLSRAQKRAVVKSKMYFAAASKLRQLDTDCK